VASGRIQEIRPCIGCQECWAGEYEPPIKCTVNPALAREKEMELRPAATTRKVLVLGGGPAGMEAARIAALRGHLVSLWEKTDSLGGQLLVADKPPAKNHIRAFRNYMVRQMDLAGVHVLLNKSATVDAVADENPDAVVVAVGPAPSTPFIPGLGRIRTVRATDVLSGRADVGRRAVVIGAGRVGCEVACFLAERGIQVAVTRRGEGVATRLSSLMRKDLVARMKELGVQVFTGVDYREATEKGLTITTSNHETVTLVADALVVAAACQPDLGLAQCLEARFEVRPVGDCANPRNIMHALREGYLAGLSI